VEKDSQPIFQFNDDALDYKSLENMASSPFLSESNVQSENKRQHSKEPKSDHSPFEIHTEKNNKTQPINRYQNNNGQKYVTEYRKSPKNGLEIR